MLACMIVVYGQAILIAALVPFDGAAMYPNSGRYEDWPSACPFPDTPSPSWSRTAFSRYGFMKHVLGLRQPTDIDHAWHVVQCTHYESGLWLPTIEGTEWRQGLVRHIGQSDMVTLKSGLFSNPIQSQILRTDIPFRPKLFNLILQSALLAAFVLIVSRGSKLAIRLRRKHRGYCLWCGYDRSGSSVCPECGKA